MNKTDSQGSGVGRPHRNGHEKQAEILQAAQRIFKEKGYHAASMQDLADAVGLQKASLYYYVTSKEDLLTALHEKFIGAFTRQLEAIVLEPLPASEKLRRAIASHVVALTEQIELFTVYVNEQRFLNARLRTRMRAEAERQAELLESIVEQGVKEGEFRQADITMTAHAVLGMCNWLYQWYSPEGKLRPEEIAVIFADLVISGLLAPTTRSRKKNSKRQVHV